MRAGKQTSKQPSLSHRSHRLFPPAVPLTVKNPFTTKKTKTKKAPKKQQKNPVNLMPLQQETVHAIDINVFINVSTVCIIITAMLY